MNTAPSPDSSQDTENDQLGNWRADFTSSVVVFLVALPLCIGIAVAVGVSPARALITGIVGGLIVGIFSGSPLQVSGPAAGLFVIIADLLGKSKEKFLASEHGLEGAKLAEAADYYSLQVLGCCVLLAGIIQIAAGQLRLGQWFRAVSPAVIKGMLAGIGALILLSQFHTMLDHTAMWHGKKAHGGLEYLATIPAAIQAVFSPDLKHDHAAITGVVALACLIIWPLVAPKKIMKFIPAALVGIIVATAFVAIIGWEVITLEDSVPANMWEEVSFPSSMWLGFVLDSSVLTGAFVIALVASAETLLCATAVDQMHTGPRTKYDQELMAQGIGNSICGFLGALPMTGVIVRSSANVNSGAKTRYSTIMHGAWLLIFCAAIPTVLHAIPKAALGALLVYTGYKLLNLKDIRALWKTSRGELFIFVATVLTIICTDLLIGVVVGIGLSAIKLLLKFSDLRMELKISEDKSTANLDLYGAATFINLPSLAGELEKVPDGAVLHVDFDELRYIDHACLDLIMNWAKQHANFGGTLVLDWELLQGRFSTVPAAGSKASGTQTQGS